MASSPGGASDLHGTTDARATAMQDQLPAKAEEFQAMDVDQHPAAALPSHLTASVHWQHPEGSSFPLPREYQLRHQNLQAQRLLLQHGPASTILQHQQPCQAASGSDAPPSCSASATATAAAATSLVSASVFSGSSSVSHPAGPGGCHLGFGAGNPDGGGGGSAASTPGWLTPSPTPYHPHSAPSPAATRHEPMCTRGDGAQACGRATCDSGRGAAGAAGWRRSPLGLVPTGGAEASGMELAGSSREGAGGGGKGGGGGRGDGEEAGPSTAGAATASGPTMSGRGLAAGTPPTTTVRPVCPYMEYDPFTAGNPPLASFYSYTLAEDADDDYDEEGFVGGEDWAEEDEGVASEDVGAQAEADVDADADATEFPGVAAAAGEEDEENVGMEHEDMSAAAATAAATAPGGAGTCHPSTAAQLQPAGRQSSRGGTRAAHPAGSEFGGAADADPVAYESTEVNGLEDMDGIDFAFDEDADEEDDDDDRLLEAGIEAAAAAANGGGPRRIDMLAAPAPAPAPHRRLSTRQVNNTWEPQRLHGSPTGGGGGAPRMVGLHPPRVLLYRRRLVGYNVRARSTANERGGHGGGGTGMGSGSGAGPRNVGSGPSSAGAGPNNAAAAGGGNGSGGWSLRYRLGPEYVSADPWSEDDEEENDTTAEQFYAAAQPKDIQGIPWERLQFNRLTYRETRLRQYRNYTNLLPDNNGGAYRAELAPLCAAPRRADTAAAAAARGPPFFTFVRNSRAVQSNIVHFQLRNLVWASSPNDVFVVHDNCVKHWNPAARTITEVLNLGGGGDGGGFGGGGAVRRAGDDTSRIQTLGRVQVSTLCVSGDLVAAGGFMGELVVKRLSGVPDTAGADAAAGGHAAAAGAAFARNGGGGRFAPTAAAAPAARGGGGGFAAGAARTRGGAVVPAVAAAAAAAGFQARGVAPPGLMGHTRGGGGGGRAGSGSLLYCGRITSSDNGITNGLEIFKDRTHGTVIMSANNDQKLRLFAAAHGEGSLRPLAQWPFDWAVNYATVRPNSHLAAVVGDDSATLLTDVHNGANVARLEGHQDFSFATAWHPGGVLLATGNQDTTTLVWDVRQTREPLTRLAGRMGAIRSLRFTPDGRFLAMSEPADFVHVYDVASGFQECQEHDFFGEIAGIAFTPDSSSLFVGISDLTYASLMQLERQRCEWS